MSAPQNDPAGFSARIAQYVEWAQVRAQTPATLDGAARHLHRFQTWCEERGVLRPSEVTRPIVERFQRHLFYTVSDRTGQPLGLSYQLALLGKVRTFFKWMVRQSYLLSNPAADLDLPRTDGRLPRDILTVEEVERIMTQPNIDTPKGLRDRAILEVVYSTGLRRMEIRNLKIDDVQLDCGVVFVRKGKGRKDRVVPIGERACHWVRAYLHEARAQLLVPPDERDLFLSNRGRVISMDHLSGMVGECVKRSGVKKTGACHMFRHTCATLMMEGGADTRYIQAMLGHAKLDTTQIYTHVAITKLKEIHTATHPGAKLKPETAFDTTEAAG